MEVQPSFQAFVARQFGERGRAWLEALPGRLDELAREWELELGDTLHGGVLSCAVAVTSAEGPAVLKVTGPWSRTHDEAAALRTWNGLAAPRLLRATHDALLLERIEPGTRAVDAEPSAVADFFRRLHVAPPAGLPSVGDHVRRLLDLAVEDGRASEDAAARALETTAELEADTEERVLLHGDLDHRNLLHCAKRGLAAIDPLPCVGDPAYDAAFWAHADRRPGARERRTAIAADLGLDRRRVESWASVITVHG
jgi:streptomycin 6-kinase